MGRTPVILVSGIAEEATNAAVIALQWDVPQAAAVRHEIDPEHEVLMRTVSDASGLIEQVEIDIEHACASCAIREDIVPTLERLAATGKFAAIIAQLPLAADGSQVCRVLGYDPDAAPHVRIATTVTALDATTLTDDLLGDDLLVERNLPVRPEDERGVAETASSMVEYSDLVLTTGAADAAGRELIHALQRPDALLRESTDAPSTDQLLAGLHHHDRTEDWVQVVRREALPPRTQDSTWILDFCSERPFHPERLRDTIETLGRGTTRSRGCFWLPSRPTQICQWDGAGGMLSIGRGDDWNGATPLTRIVVVGRGSADDLEDAFEHCLLTDAELGERGRFWEVTSDGYEPWLGPVHTLPNREAS